MSTLIGTLAYKIIAQTADFTKGVQATRGELRLAKQVMQDSLSPTQQYATALDGLRLLFHKGAISLDAYNQHAEKLKSLLPEHAEGLRKAAEAQDRLNSLKAQADSITAKYATADERHAELLGRLNTLRSEAGLSEETYKRALEDSQSKLPAVIEAEQRLADIRAFGAQVTNRYMTDTERYVAQATKLVAALNENAISEEKYNAALADAQKLLPGVAAEERKHAEELARIAKVKEEAVTIEERVRDSVLQTWKDKKAGILTEQQYTAKIAQLKGTLPAVIEATRKRNEIVQRGKQIIDSTRTAEERYHIQLRETHRLYKQGAIDADTYHRRRQQLATSYVNSKSTGGTGGLSLGGLGGLAKFAAPLAAPIVGAMSISQLARGMVEDLGELGKLADVSSKLGVVPAQLELMRYAGERTGSTIESVDKSMQTFTRRTVQAAYGTGLARNALKELGLDADNLLKMPLSERMKLIADSFTRVRSPADQLRLSMSLFGNAGGDLVNLLKKGSDGLDELFKRREGLGFLPNKDDLARSQEANDAMADAALALNLAFQEGAVALAPIVKDLSLLAAGGGKWLSDLGKGGLKGDAGKWLGLAMMPFAAPAGLLMYGNASRNDAPDPINAPSAPGGLLPTGPTEAEKVGKDFTTFMKSMNEQISVVGLTSDEAKMQAFRQNAEGNLTPAQIGAAEWKLAHKAELERQHEMATSAKGFEEQLHKQIATIGMTAEAVKLWELAESGLDSRRQSSLRLLMKELEAKQKLVKANEEAKKKAEKLAEAGKGLTKEFSDPAEKLKDRLNELFEIFSAGKIDIETLVKAAEAARKEFEKPLKKTGPQAITKGSQEAFEMLALDRQALIDARKRHDFEKQNRSRAAKSRSAIDPMLGPVHDEAAMNEFLRGGYPMYPQEPLPQRTPLPSTNIDQQRREKFESFMSEYLRQIAENTAKPPIEISTVDQF